MARAKATPPVATIDPVPQPSPSAGPANRLPLIFLDCALVALFLGLVFLLGVFPLNDTDFWWHLRTGDLIRQTGQVPRVDPFLFGGQPDKPWIDLHWIYQVLLSVGYQHGGVDLLTLAKCAMTTLALGIVLLARRPGSPLWVMVLAWIPALLLLAGRMYVRPETLTLLYLLSFVAILSRWEEHPRLALLLPPIQLLWVNSQGLFVLGLGLIACALLHAALQPGALEPQRRPWWRFALGIAIASGAVCLINPYGLQGALFPLQLLGTMSNPIFSEAIAELEPVPSFIRRAGWNQPSIQIYLATLAVGAASFLLPMLWSVGQRLKATRSNNRPQPPPAASPRGKKSRKATTAIPAAPPAAATVRPTVNLFRVLLFLAFSVLSWKATRNSQQFAAIVGTLSAWNFAEWVDAIRRARQAGAPSGADSPPSVWPGVAPRLFSLATLAGVFALVISGAYYAHLGEGRTVGLGEKPLWFPHDAVRFAQAHGMPAQFVCIHNGHSAVWEYHNGPARKVYTDARLEVIGPALFQEYLSLQESIRDNRAWDQHLAAMGNPGLLLDLVQTGSPALSASLMTNPAWRCVWLDPIAAVFVHESYREAGPAVDFRHRHFEPDDPANPGDNTERVALARILRDIGGPLAASQPTKAATLFLLGHGYAHQVLEHDPASPEAWKLIGQIENLRDTVRRARAEPRFRLPFDPLIDLSPVRATRALIRSLETRPDDFSALVSLIGLYQSRAMDDAALAWIERVLAIRPGNDTQRRVQAELARSLPALKATVNRPPPHEWRNRSELENQVASLLERGFVQTAADLLEAAYKPEARSWEISDRIATLRLHLGDTAGARRVWEEATAPPRPSLRDSRLALTHLADENYQAARDHLTRSLETDPTLFEALYLATVLEADAGNQALAIQHGMRALGVAPGALGETAVRHLLRTVGASEGGTSPALNASPRQR